MTPAAPDPGPARRVELALDGMRNARDLGGIAVAGGAEIRAAALLRSESPGWAPQPIWARLGELGVRTAIDLRALGEPDLGAPEDSSLTVVRAPLFDFDFDVLVDSWRGEIDLIGFYLYVLAEFADRIAAAARALALAEPGAVLVHCNMGKDRTGLLIALLLDALGARREAIAADYALSAASMAAPLAEWVALGGDDANRQMRARVAGSGAEEMLAVLSEVDRRYAGSRAYLAAGGLKDEQLRLIERRLLVAPAADPRPTAAGER